MSKSISIEPKTQKGHKALGTALLILSIIFAASLFVKLTGFGLVITGLLVVATVNEFRKANDS